MLKLFIAVLVLVVTSLSVLSLGWIKSSEFKENTNPALKISRNIPYQFQTPTIEQIFSKDHSQFNSLPKNQIISLIATGDIIPARTVNFQTVNKNNFLWPYEKVADFLKSADITFINLEAPLLKKCPLTNEGMIFCGDERHIQGLILAGVDVVNLANNHSKNYGQAGIEETTKLLEKNNILSTGVAEPVFKDIKGLRFAFLGYDDVSSLINKESLKLEIMEAKSKADVLVVAFHWGVEYVSQPTERQKELAHLAINSGADLVIGNHPHWIQPVEIYQDRIITYAHGNFIFDQEWSQKTKEGVVGKYTFYNKKIIDVEFFPVQIKDFGQPYFVDGAQKQQILEDMKQESLKLLK